MHHLSCHNGLSLGLDPPRPSSKPFWCFKGAVAYPCTRELTASRTGLFQTRRRKDSVPLPDDLVLSNRIESAIHYPNPSNLRTFYAFFPSLKEMYSRGVRSGHPESVLRLKAAVWTAINQPEGLIYHRGLKQSPVPTEQNHELDEPAPIKDLVWGPSRGISFSP